MDIKDATINAIGIFFIGRGTSLTSSLSRIPDIKSKTIVNPTPAQNPCTTQNIKLSIRLSAVLRNISLFKTATPNTAQFVAIRARYIPKIRYKAGLNFCINISISCTKLAITSINDKVRRYSIWNGFNKKLYTAQVIIDEAVITNVTASPMYKAVFVSLDTPIKGQSPRNFERIKLFINITLMTIINK